MVKIYKDDIVKFNEYNLEDNKDIFKTILNVRRNEIDSKRFYLKYISQEVLDTYDFNNKESLKKFRCDCLRYSILQGMGGCNLNTDDLKKGFIYSGIQISDPSGVPGIFYIIDKKIIYNPLHSQFYKNRDVIKFANETYFTKMTFEEIMLTQIELAKEYYVQKRGYETAQELMDIQNSYEKVNKEEMMGFVLDKERGDMIRKKIWF